MLIGVCFSLYLPRTHTDGCGHLLRSTLAKRLGRCGRVRAGIRFRKRRRTGSALRGAWVTHDNDDDDDDGGSGQPLSLASTYDRDQISFTALEQLGAIILSSSSGHGDTHGNGAKLETTLFSEFGWNVFR